MNVNDPKWAKLVLDELSEINEDLLILYDDFRDGDTHDATARRESLAALSEFNEKFEPLERAVNDMIEFIERATGIQRTAADSAAEIIAAGFHANMLRGRQPHTLGEERITSAKPYGYTLLGQARADTRAWTELYCSVLTQLASHDAERFTRLPAIAEFNRDLSSRFDTDPAGFRTPLPLPCGLYTECRLTASTIGDNIRRLLAHFSIPECELVIYLREDHGAE